MDVQQKRDAVESPKSQSPINEASSSVSVNNASSQTNNGNNVDDCHCSEEDVSKYPVGYRFQPTDEELVGYYLRKKVANLNLPINMSTAYEVQLYRYNPQYLAGFDLDSNPLLLILVSFFFCAYYFDF